MSEWPGGVSKQQLIEHESQTPNVTLGVVLLFEEELRSHVQGSATAFFDLAFMELVQFFGKPEISYPVHLVLDEHIIRLYISMDVAMLVQKFKSFGQV